MPESTVNVPLAPGKRNLLFFAMMAQVFGFMLTSYCPGIALPTILTKFNAMESYALVGVIYAFCECIVIPIAAGLGDKIGRKWLLIGSLLIMCVSSVFVYYAQSFILFLVFWGVCGAAGGVYLMGPYLVMGDIIEPAKTAKFAGLLTSALSAGMIVGPLLGGVIVDAGLERLVYLLPIPLNLFSVFALLTIYPSKKSADSFSFDALGTLLLVLCVGSFVFLLNFGGKLFAWLSLPTLACVAVLFIAGGLLIKCEGKATVPAIDLKQLKNRPVALCSCFGFLFNAYAVLSAGFVVLLAQAVLNTSATVSGTIMLPQTIVSLIFPLFLGPWMGSNKNRYRLCFILEGILAAVTLIGISRLTGNRSLVILYALMAVGGFANSFHNTNLVPYFLLSADPAQLGAGQGVFNFFGVLGVTLTSSLFGLMLGAAPDYVSGLSWSFVAGGVLCLCLTVIALVFLKKEPIQAKN